MTEQELKDLLGIAPSPVNMQEREQEPHREDDYQPNSDTALTLDRWDRERGDAVLKNSKVAQSLNMQPLEMADFHAAAFLTEPELVEASYDRVRHTFVKELLDSAPYKELRQSTTLNYLASEMAATEFAKEYAKVKKQNPLPENRKPSPQEIAKLERACMRCARKALSKAQEEVDELETMQNALGCGPGQSGEGTMSLEEVTSLFQKTRNNRQLRRILELAGRYRLMAQGKQRQKTQHGYEDLIGVKLDDTLDFLLSEELALLSSPIPAITLDAQRRLLEREMIGLDYQGKEHVGRGPIIVCVDESGSMSGEPVAQAKAFALAMAWVARHQNRYCALVGYSGGTEGTLCVLPPGKWDENALLKWLEHFFSGGTSMDMPLEELPRKYWPRIGAPKGKTDLILITDGIVSVPDDMRQRFLAWKVEEKVRCISLILSYAAGDLETVSDEVHLIHDLGLQQEAIGRCLSV